MRQNSISLWMQWLEEFNITEADNVTIESEAHLIEIEQEGGFSLPESYKGFCQTFGTCLFYNTPRIYCPNSFFSEMSLYSLREEFELKNLNLWRERVNNPSPFDNTALESIERMLSGYGLVFADDATATIYLFDLASYKLEDKSCDIWKASGEGIIEDFSFLGRSFYDFFLSHCVDIEKQETVSETMELLSEEKMWLRRFDVNRHLGI